MNLHSQKDDKVEKSSIIQDTSTCDNCFSMNKVDPFGNIAMNLRAKKAQLNKTGRPFDNTN